MFFPRNKHCQSSFQPVNERLFAANAACKYKANLGMMNYE
jgi:hypothetical protein